MKNKSIYKVLIIFIFITILLTPNIFAQNTNSLKLSASCAVLIDSSSGKVLYAKNAYSKAYPASLTKVLTAVVVLENCELDEVATVSKTAIDGIEYGYVTANLKAGEKLTVEQLLNILLVSSANDAALVLAEHVSGSVENFSIEMNKKASEIGCTSSNFINPNGVHDENHYSTAYDLALIGKYAMQFEDFKEIIAKTSYTLPKTNLNSKARKFYTTNELIMSSNKNYYKYAIGMKTGYTTPAGHCLISYSEKNDLPIISVVLNSKTSNNRYSDTKTLFEYGSENYYLNRIASEGNRIQTISIKNATSKTKKLNVVLDKDIFIVMDKNSSASLVKSEISFKEDLKAPIMKNDIVGNITYTFDGITYSANLLADSDVKVSYVPLFFLLLFICLFIVLIISKKKKKSKKRKRSKYIYK